MNVYELSTVAVYNDGARWHYFPCWTVTCLYCWHVKCASQGIHFYEHYKTQAPKSALLVKTILAIFVSKFMTKTKLCKSKLEMLDNGKNIVLSEKAIRIWIFQLNQFVEITHNLYFLI